MKINHAVLHVFDFVSCANTYAQEEIDLSNKNAKRYIMTHARRVLNNMDNKRGEFSSDSLFAPRLKDYFRGERSFVGISTQIAEYIAGELGHMEKTESSDLLVVDFEDDPDSSVREMTEEESETAYKAQGKRYFALLLLESRQAYMHELNYGENGNARNDITRHHAILPNPSQKVHSFAVIESKTLSVAFCDKQRTIAGQERWLIPEGLLQCSMEASSKEVFDTVKSIVEEVAAEHGTNTAVAVSRVKNYVAENAEISDEVSPEELGREVFLDDDIMQKHFEEAVAEKKLPQKVVVEKAVAKRVSKSHKIHTDTGIDITFPAEYGENTDFIEFVKTPEGYISIQLKNIGKIENR